MDFIDLKAVIQHMQEDIKCQKCGGKFDERMVRLIATLDNEGLIATFCSKCKLYALINFGLTKVIRPIHGETTKITLKEVIDIHNFLKDFQGDLKELLT